MNLKPKRRWLQVSLRTMLLLVTLLCVALSLWVVPLERRRRAVNAIEALGGIVIFVNNETRQESFSVAFLRPWLPQAFVDEVEEVDFSKSIQNTDAGLAHLHGLTSLKRLALDNPIITDAGLAHLQGLTSLQVLDLENSQVTDAGLAHLHGLTNLEWLWLNNTQVTNAGLAKLRKALPNCNIRVNRSVPFSHLLRPGENTLLIRSHFADRYLLGRNGRPDRLRVHRLLRPCSALPPRHQSPSNSLSLCPSLCSRRIQNSVGNG